MGPLGSLTQAWPAAEAALPLGWQVTGPNRVAELGLAVGEGPAFDDDTSGSRPYVEQALRWLPRGSGGAGDLRLEAVSPYPMAAVSQER
jgi:hypothetical protein